MRFDDILKSKCKNFNTISRIILMIGMPIISITLLYIPMYLLNTPPYNVNIAYAQAIIMLEHVMMSLTLLLGGALLIDSVLK